MAEVSIIVPVYNSGKNIEACIKSILNQTYEDFELILVNDGSKDNSGEICKEYAAKDKRIVLIEQENAGVSAARNRGIDHAGGDYIVFVDSDDIIPKDYVGNMVHAQKCHGKNSFIISAMQIVSPNKAVPEQRLTCGVDKETCLEKKDILRIFEAYLLNSPCNKFFHTTVIKEQEIRMKKGMSIAEDMYFNIQYWQNADFHKVIVLNDNFYEYIRTGEESLDNKYNPTYYESHALAYSELEKCCKELSVDGAWMDILLMRYFSIIERSLDNTMHPDCELKWWKRWHKNGIILKDDLFVRALQNCKDELSRGRYMAYRSGCYGMVWAYNKWSAFKNRNK